MAKVEHLSLGSLDAEVRILIYVLGAIHVAALVSAVTRMHTRTIAPIKTIARRLTLSCTHTIRAQMFWCCYAFCIPQRPHEKSL